MAGRRAARALLALAIALLTTGAYALPSPFTMSDGGGNYWYQAGDPLYLGAANVASAAQFLTERKHTVPSGFVAIKLAGPARAGVSSARRGWVTLGA